MARTKTVPAKATAKPAPVRGIHVHVMNGDVVISMISFAKSCGADARPCWTVTAFLKDFRDLTGDLCIRTAENTFTAITDENEIIDKDDYYFRLDPQCIERRKNAIEDRANKIHKYKESIHKANYEWSQALKIYDESINAKLAAQCLEMSPPRTRTNSKRLQFSPTTIFEALFQGRMKRKFDEASATDSNITDNTLPEEIVVDSLLGVANEEETNSPESSQDSLITTPQNSPVKTIQNTKNTLQSAPLQQVTTPLKSILKQPKLTSENISAYTTSCGSESGSAKSDKNSDVASETDTLCD